MRLAGEILENSGTRSRVENGYTRVDPIAIAESEGIDVMARPLDKLLGAFLREERVGILLNNQRPSGMFHMTCAHELGHFYLGHLTSTDEHLDYRSDASEAELEADQFAYALMAPLWLIARVLKAQGWGWNSMRDPVYPLPTVTTPRPELFSHAVVLGQVEKARQQCRKNPCQTPASGDQAGSDPAGGHP